MKHRSLALELIAAGRVRLNSVRVAKASHVVKSSDVLTLALQHDVKVVRVLAEAARRGPATDAQLLYEEVNPEKMGA